MNLAESAHRPILHGYARHNGRKYIFRTLTTDEALYVYREFAYSVSVHEVIEQMGKEGWELCAIMGENYDYREAYFKRRI